MTTEAKYSARNSNVTPRICGAISKEFTAVDINFPINISSLTGLLIRHGDYQFITDLSTKYSEEIYSAMTCFLKKLSISL